MSSLSASDSEGSHAGSPTMLTPRSKVKAMLAALDEKSDDENTAGPKDVAPKTSTSVSYDIQQGTNSATTIGSDSSAEDEDDEAPIARPRGRMAARMGKSTLALDSRTDDTNESARDRVRRLLSAAKHTPAIVSPIKTASKPDSGSEDDQPKTPETSRIRKRKITTPHSTGYEAQAGSSNGLFVSPSRSIVADPDGGGQTDDELPRNPASNSRLLGLVAKKRAERLAKEDENRRRKMELAAQQRQNETNHEELLEEDEDMGSDIEGARQLTQQVRPTRKASKKALEEMHRETQRMSRNMQLAHQARTKKKITKSSLFAKFNYKPEGFVDLVSDPVQETTSSSPIPSDAMDVDTPPTSPLAEEEAAPNEKVASTNLSVLPNGLVEEEDDALPSLEVALSGIVPASPPHIEQRDKGKGKAVEQVHADEQEGSKLQKSLAKMRTIRVHPASIPSMSKHNNIADNDDDDLEIVTANRSQRKGRLDDIFDRVPAKQSGQSNSLHTLRMLANVTSPGKTRKATSKPSVSLTELQVSLQQMARRQAAREREERLEVLRSRGIIVQSAEEREKEVAEIEDLMAKARREGEEIMRREKKLAEADGGNTDALNSDDDDEWKEEKEDFAEKMSGTGPGDADSMTDASDSSSEDSMDDEELDEESQLDEEDPIQTEGLVLSEASETESVDEELGEQSEEEDVYGPAKEDPARHSSRRRRTAKLVLSDEEEDDDAVLVHSPAPLTDSPPSRVGTSPAVPPSVLRSATKTFIPGVTVAGPAGLGLTQIFAGTMDDPISQDVEGQIVSPLPPTREFDNDQDSMAFLKNFPAPSLPEFEPTMHDEIDDVVRDSQSQINSGHDVQDNDGCTQEVNLIYQQSQIHDFDSLPLNSPTTQMSECPEPTQDDGFMDRSPLKGRFADAPPSTIDTVLIESSTPIEIVQESPAVKKRGRLQKRLQRATLADDDEARFDHAKDGKVNELDQLTDAFDVLRRAAKRKLVVQNDFDKTKSGAREMVQEQAEESEDEFAGLGGNSDDDSGEEDMLVKEMIDDEGGKDVDASKLAAFYADRERANDEKQVEKLFRDITNGNLRKKRGANYDLSDSDDDGEARRRMKRKEFAKMRKALLEDERIGKIAENPKRLAFLRAIEDHGADEETNFLDDHDDTQEGTDSQSQAEAEAGQTNSQSITDSQSQDSMAPPKRKLSTVEDNAIRLPPHLRRTKTAKRPSNLSEIRHSLSSLIDEPNTVVASEELSDYGSDLDDEADIAAVEEQVKEKENRDPFAMRRTKNVAIVDRIMLKRASSTTVSTSTRMAFAASAAGAVFKVPALLRRATTNSSLTSASAALNVTERTAGGSLDDGKTVAKKAGKNSGVHYFAREAERRAAVQEGEKRREQKRFKGAEGRRKVVGNLFGAGTFD